MERRETNGPPIVLERGLHVPGFRQPSIRSFDTDEAFRDRRLGRRGNGIRRCVHYLSMVPRAGLTPTIKVSLDEGFGVAAAVVFFRAPPLGCNRAGYLRSHWCDRAAAAEYGPAIILLLQKRKRDSTRNRSRRSLRRQQSP